ncbi:hypothetical protein HMI56_005262 [Coelomomyces lativittatus]|nr:hypothetical protein HMI56_005262 [Coelomomyces lativittatus]
MDATERDSFGTLAFFKEIPRLWQMYMLTSTLVLEIPNETYLKDIQMNLQRDAKQWNDAVFFYSCLKTCSYPLIQHLIQHPTYHHQAFPKSYVLCTQGTPLHQLTFIKSGSVLVSRFGTCPSQSVKVAVKATGEYFGEEGVLVQGSFRMADTNPTQGNVPDYMGAFSLRLDAQRGTCILIFIFYLVLTLQRFTLDELLPKKQFIFMVYAP